MCKTTSDINLIFDLEQNATNISNYQIVTMSFIILLQ